MLNKKFTAILDMEVLDDESPRIIYAAIPVDSFAEAAAAAEEYCDNDLISVKIELLDTGLLTFGADVKQKLMEENY